MTRHLVVAVALVAVAVAGGVHYEAVEERHWPYPTEDQLAEDYDRYVGERALVFGTVRSVDEAGGTAVVVVESDGEEVELTVRGFEERVEPGGVVQVYGTLGADRTIAAEGIVVVERGPGERLFKFAVSAVGAVLALGAFFRYWRIDRSALTFEPR